MWAEYTEQLYDNTSPEDLHHVACLRVPHSFYSQLPLGYIYFRERVAHHQYMMLHIVYQLRKEFTMPPRDNEETQPNQSVSAGACFVGYYIYIFSAGFGVPMVERIRMLLCWPHLSALVAYNGGTNVGHGPVRTLFLSLIWFPVPAHWMLAMALSRLFSWA